jgi:hypothetical protein
VGCVGCLDREPFGGRDSGVVKGLLEAEEPFVHDTCIVDGRAGEDDVPVAQGKQVFCR